MDRAGGASSTSTRSSSGCRTCWWPATRASTAQEIKVFGARECLERVREHPLWRGRDELPDGRGHRRRARLLARRPGARGRDLQARRRRQADRRHRRRRHERHRERVHRDRRRDVRARRGQRARRPPATRRARPTAASRAARRSPTRTAARSSAPPPRRASGCCGSPSRELEIAPEDLELVDGEVRPLGSPGRGDRDRRPGGQDVHLRQPARADRGLRRRRPGQPRARRRRAPRRTCGSTARPAA